MVAPHCLLLVFEVSDLVAALPLADVERVAPIAQLAHPPGLPPAIEGFLNLSGATVSVLRLDRLLGLTPRDPGLYSVVILMKKEALPKGNELKGNGAVVGVLVDRVSEILSVPEAEFLPVSEDASFNGCARAAVSTPGWYIHVLSSQRLLLEKEARSLYEFQAMAEQRLEQWGAGQ